jgi:hypothetical protein
MTAGPADHLAVLQAFRRGTDCARAASDCALPAGAALFVARGCIPSTSCVAKGTQLWIRLKHGCPHQRRHSSGILAATNGGVAHAAYLQGYQRRATLLVYLNDVREGGATRFDRLGFAVQPKRGRALLFFPAFSGGMPDARCVCVCVV